MSLSPHPTLPFVETMLTQACNLSCKGCSNYSDLTHKGYLSWAEGREWLTEWNKVIHIPDFGIMGGEPLINPECKDWVYGVRELLPESQIRFTTNGLLLDRRWDVFDAVQDIGNAVFKITVHVNDSKLESIIDDIFSRYNWQPINEFGIDRWVSDNGVRFQINRPEQFIKTFRNEYSNMQPWDSNPKDAFDNCIQQTCPLMYNGRIYKCSTAGLLKAVLERHGNPNWDDWQPYLSEGIHWESNMQDIQQFINNFGKPNKICSQCPSKKDTASIVNHKIHVATRKQFTKKIK